MGLIVSHHRQVRILVLDDKLDCFGLLRKKFGQDKTVQLFIRDQSWHLGLMAPHSQSVSSLSNAITRLSCKNNWRQLVLEPTTETSRSSGGLAGRTTTHLHSGLEFGLWEKKFPVALFLWSTVVGSHGRERKLDFEFEFTSEADASPGYLTFGPRSIGTKHFQCQAQNFLGLV